MGVCGKGDSTLEEHTMARVHESRNDGSFGVGAPHRRSLFAQFSGLTDLCGRAAPAESVSLNFRV
jgi:hypothetical protein